MKTWVIKVGGRLCDDAGIRAELCCALVAAECRVVLVHGGGCVVSELQHALGQRPSFVEGRRATDAGEMAAVEMALSGAVNKALVRAVAHAGGRAVGLSGVDGDMVRCTLVPGLGAVGMPAQVRVDVIEQLLGAGWLPVLSPVSMGPAGEPVNVNADEFACAVAVALGAERLLLLSDVPAVRVAGVGQARVAADAVEGLILRGEVTDGMVPKLRSAMRAVRAGVGEVRIAGFSAPLGAIEGTSVVQAPVSISWAV